MTYTSEQRHEHETHQSYGHTVLRGYGCAICDDKPKIREDEEPGEPHDWESIDAD